MNLTLYPLQSNGIAIWSRDRVMGFLNLPDSDSQAVSPNKAVTQIRLCESKEGSGEGVLLAHECFI